ncbi:helix-turn-helix domain-containing protein [Aliarcobacter lanthieri]|uniref:helix-turn-helix domain-containing protein n=1 Tax=Aliarcobacter lanthieri TaxID=1355374 RepID=UPI00047C7D31|nr:AraC family transcriptional regulator [Aliarcobacter lanthieri]QKF60322.1 transcriptional regulator, AraC family [Aliarcobacter lanthieri]
MTNLSRSKLYEVGKVLLKEERSKSFVKQVARVNNQYINLNIVNAMIEDNIYLNIVDNVVKQSHIQKLRSKKNEQLQIRLILQGKLEKLDQFSNEKIIYNENEISVEYKKDIEESLLNKQGEHIKYICITLNEHYLSENSYISDMFKDNFSKKFYEPNLKNKFLEVFNREYSSGLDKIYLKNKTMEIIFYVFEELKKDEIKIEMLNEEDIKRVKKAKLYIEDYFYENITIPLLSKKVALNTTKLKKGFKELFGKTVGEFLRDYRLEKAVTYLKENKYSVREVSLMCGYTNQASFSYAFSSQYNTKPKDVLKKSDL